MITLLISVAILLFTMPAFAQNLSEERIDSLNQSVTENFDCEIDRKDMLYPKAVELDRAGDPAAAKYYCALAMAGDDRAQFKYAVLLYQNERSANDTIIASALLGLSNAGFHSIKKIKLIDEVDSQLSPEEKHLRDELFVQLVNSFDSGRRFDDDHGVSPKELEKLKDRRRIFTGSRIKRENADALPLSGN